MPSLTRTFGLTLFAGAFLLFVLEPLFGRLLLPRLGGAPAVWNTCLVFFQITLLAGYGYAWASTRWLSPRAQLVLHAALALGAVAVLPVRIVPDWLPPAEASPVAWVLGVMAVSIGLPFLVVSTTAPLLQHWFSRTDHPDASDPYFLYQASNLGSMAGLLAYPIVIEPWLGLRHQGMAWTAGYVAFAGLLLACARATVRGRRVGATRPAGASPGPAPVAVTWRRVAWWIALAAVPSSLLLGVTTMLSTDVAVVPLLWVVPLLLYLGTFVVAFARRPLVSLGAATIALPMLVLPAVIVLVMRTNEPVWLMVPLHLLTFTVMALVCHGRLASERPHPDQLTLFYLCMSIGGALGGLFNALVAPVVFPVPLEYPLAIVAAGLVKPYRDVRGREAHAHRNDVLLPLGLFALGAAVVWVMRRFGQSVAGLELPLALGVPAFLCFAMSSRPVRFGLGLAALFCIGLVRPGEFGTVADVERSFFGVHRVYTDTARNLRLLFHGSTMHGVQSLDPARSSEPLAYYTTAGPIGQVFDGMRGGRPRSVAVVGLGAGALAGYARAGQEWTFFEIDPTVVRLARDAGYFSYLASAPSRIDVVVGDARTSMARLDRTYDLIVLDAFSSDAVPVHLLTREALQLYLSRLSDGGVLAFHISNRYVRLRRLFSALARDAGLAHVIQIDRQLDPDSRLSSWTGGLPSDWVLLARTRADLAALHLDERWMPIADSPVRVWTDDYSNLLALFRWR
jgi:predicted membrane-bound spermidine synthase